jgi:predicted Zn-dependent protease with MMP-like domain
MRLGNYQEVALAERVDVHNGEGPLIIIDLHRRDLAIPDLTKHAVHHLLLFA